MPLGLPHSKFLAWSELDQDKALMWRALESLKCSKCGTIPEDWMDEEGYPLDPPPFVVRTVHCLGCEGIEMEYSNIPQDTKGITAYLARPSGRPEFGQ